MPAQHHKSHTHQHGAHVHSQHGSFVHEPAAAADRLYRQAYEDAQPDAGRKIVAVELEAREVDWAVAPGAVSAPGPSTVRFRGPSSRGA